MRGWFQQLQRAVHKGYIVVVGDDVNVVRHDHHSIRRFMYLHTGIVTDQFYQNALVVRGQMLHQDKGHACFNVCGHGGKECLKRRQPPGRCADANDRKTLLRLWLRTVIGLRSVTRFYIIR